MRKLVCNSAIGLALFSPVTFAAQLEDLQSLLGKGGLFILIAVAIIAALVAYFMRLRDKRAAPLRRLFQGEEAIHAVGPDALVTECVRKMMAERIGALIVMDGARLTGIFTERDALNKVLGPGLDPRSTKVSEVMTKNPYCVPPTMTVRAAMELVTQRRFRHLPIVEDGKVLAVVSSGDLTHWLVKDQLGEVKELVDLAARS
ncbi:MAG: CBS domain-containing protein [Betaproteobacteria bacterium]|nr:CBS domain-containing protein [Betaproteobacteria bacterium]